MGSDSTLGMVLILENGARLVDSEDTHRHHSPLVSTYVWFDRDGEKLKIFKRASGSFFKLFCNRHVSESIAIVET